MIRTKFISDIKDVPITWVFEWYLKLPEQLCGQDIMIKSIFNLNDKIPSFNIYWSKKHNCYKFRDFSSGNEGSHIDLIKFMFNLTIKDSMFRIVRDYDEFIKKNQKYNSGDYKEYSKYKVESFIKRKWNTLDKTYWLQYGIGSKLLEEYNVCALESYKMQKEEEGIVKELTITGNHLYGYLRSDGNIYKVYQPKIKDKKFIKVKSYIQGTDQLKLEAPILVICSSLKDLMCLINFKWNIEAVAPDSENTLIPEHMIRAYQHKYKYIVTLMDNDEAGIKSMKKYQEKYQIPYVLLDGEKDVSDNIVKFGKEVINDKLWELIYNKLTDESRIKS